MSAPTDDQRVPYDPEQVIRGLGARLAEATVENAKLEAVIASLLEAQQQAKRDKTDAALRSVTEAR